MWCTDPAIGGLTRGEIEAVGYEWRSLPDELDRLEVDATTTSGERLDREVRPFEFIANPAMGLWSTRDRLA